MLNQKSINIANHITSVLADENMVVKELPGTPVAFLNNAMSAIPFDDESYAPELVLVMARHETGSTRHESEMGPIVNLMRKKLSGLHKFVRNTVNPLIKDTVGRYSEAKSNLENMTEIDLKVVPVKIDDVFDDWKLVNILEPWERDPVSTEFTIKPEFVEQVSAFITGETLLSTCKSGSDSLDAFIELYLENNPNAMTTWYQRTKSLTPSENFLYHEDIIHLMFIRGLLNGKLTDFPLDYITPEIKAQLTVGMRAKGQDIINRFRAINRSVDNLTANEFVIDYDKPKESAAYSSERTLSSSLAPSRVVYVYHDAFMTWLDGGGDVDAIISAILIHGFNPGAFKEAASNTLELVEALALRRSQKKIVDQVKLMSTLENTVNLSISNWIMSKEDLDTEGKIQLQKLLAKNLIDIPYTPSRDVHEWVRELVCKTIASNLMGYELLSMMEATLAANSEITVDDAAISATSFIVAKWLATQLNVVKVGPRLFKV